MARISDDAAVPHRVHIRPVDQVSQLSPSFCALWTWLCCAGEAFPLHSAAAELSLHPVCSGCPQKASHHQRAASITRPPSICPFGFRAFRRSSQQPTNGEVITASTLAFPSC